MKNVNEILPAATTAQPLVKRSEIPGGRIALINQLFATMLVQYPTFLKNEQRESEVKRMWAAHLSECNDDQILRAATAMIDIHPTFAPTIGDFKKLIRETRARPEHQDFHLALPAPSNPSIQKREMAKMRAALSE